MMYKKLLAITLGGILATSATSIFADGLSMSSSGVTSAIEVSCNGTTLPYELQPNTIINDIPWSLIAIAFNSQTLNCTFTLDDAKQNVIGSAKLNINEQETEGEISNVQYAPNYKVIITPSQNIYEQSMSLSLQQG